MFIIAHNEVFITIIITLYLCREKRENNSGSKSSTCQIHSWQRTKLLQIIVQFVHLSIIKRRELCPNNKFKWKEILCCNFIGIKLINLKLKRRFFICSVVLPYFRSMLISLNYVQTNYFHGNAYILWASPVVRATCNLISDLSSI